MSRQNYDRNPNPDSEGKEVKSEYYEDLIKKDIDDVQALKTLRERYGDKFTEKIFDVYKERKRLIEKKASKFASLMFTKYTNLGLPALLEKARKYKKKYELSEAEFAAFISHSLNNKKFVETNLYNQPTTPMSKTLGYHADISAGKMNVPTSELDVLQDIMKMHAEAGVLHETIKIQSLTYEDCAPHAITGKYDSTKFNSYSFIHPVVAALFFPRIRYIDEHMLLSSIGNIVYCRYNGVPIRTQPDYEVYWDLITDPNEIVCVSPKESSLVDLRNRYKLQIELWKLVRELREGRYYSETFRDFNMVLDSCRNGTFDAPDMSNVRDEGTVLRRLFGMVGLRPTTISTSNVTTTVMTGNYNLNPMALTQVFSIPIVNMRLPFNFRHRGISVRIEEALEQPDWFVENKMLVMKLKSIIYSRDIIVFYANRRFQSLNFARINAPYNFTVLPPTHSAFETINDINVNYDPSIIVGDDRFYLRSVVFVERAITNKDLIIGSSTGLIVRRDLSSGRFSTTYLLYNPQASVVKFESGGRYVANPPLVEIPGHTPFTPGAVESFQKRASTRGTIFIYVKDRNQKTPLKGC